MTIQIEMNKIKKSLPELLILILAKHYPLRIKEIHNKLKDLFQVKLSFQAVRKALNLMVDQGKLVLKKNEYQINKNWIKDNKKTSDELVDRYFLPEQKEKPPEINKIGHEIQVFHFENSLQTDKFFGELLLEAGLLPGKKVLCIQAMHYWYPLGHLGIESDFILEMKKRNTELYYLSFGGNHLLDRLSKQFYEQHDIRFEIIKENFEKDTELAVIGDFVFKIRYPPEFIKNLEKIFKKTKDMKQFNFLELGKLIKSNYSISLTMFRDKSIAKSVRESTLRYF